MSTTLWPVLAAYRMMKEKGGKGHMLYIRQDHTHRSPHTLHFHTSCPHAAHFHTCRAATLITLARSAPLKPGVARAITCTGGREGVYRSTLGGGVRERGEIGAA